MPVPSMISVDAQNPKSMRDLVRGIAAAQKEAAAEKEALERKMKKLMVPYSWLETTEQHTIVVELPGVDRSELKVTMAGVLLTVSGERKSSQDDSSAKVHVNEQCHGVFSRTFKLGPNAKLDELKTSFTNGVLVITVPKAGERVVHITN